MNITVKKNIISIVLTIAVISLLIFSGPARAIDVSLNDLPDQIDISTAPKITFNIKIDINDGEFLPVLSTNLIFSSEGNEDRLCTIQDKTTDCPFLTVDDKLVEGLNQNYGYGYGYGYGYFGYGYGYGASATTGSITYKLTINPSLLPVTFINKDIGVIANVIGGSQDNQATFTGESGFHVLQSQDAATEVAAVKNKLTYDILLNGNADKDNIISDLKLHSSLTGSAVAITWVSSNSEIISNTGKVIRPNADTDVTLTATLQKGEASDTKEFIFNVKELVEAITPDAEGTVDVTNDKEVVIDNSNAAALKEIVVPKENTGIVSLNLRALMANNKVTTGTNDLNLTRESSTATYTVTIPQNTVITGEADWNGIITVPTLKLNSDVTLSDGAPTVVLEIGSSSVKLTFDNAVRILIPGQAGQSVAYERNDVVTKITDTCADDTQATNDGLAPEGDCKIDVGSDLAIWTKHFTKFVTYTPTSTTTTASAATTNAGGNGGTRVGVIPAGTITEEAPAETATEVTPTLTTPTAPATTNAITGAVIGAVKNNSTALIIIVSVVAVILVLTRVSIRNPFGKGKGKNYKPSARYE